MRLQGQSTFAESLERLGRKVAGPIGGVICVLAAFFLAALFWPDGQPDRSEVSLRAQAGLGAVSPSGSPGLAPSPVRPQPLDFDGLLEQDPLLAARHVAELNEGDPERDRLLGILMRYWADRDPGGASAWLEDLPVGAFRSDATQDLVSAWSERSPEEVVTWATDELLEGRLMAASALLSAWGAQDPEAAGAWLEGLSRREDLPDKAIASLTASLAYSWGQSDGPAAAEWALSDRLGTTSRTQAIVNVAAGWAQHDPLALSVWLEQAVDAGEPAAVASHVTLASHWAGSSPETAGQWAVSLAEQGLRELTLSAFVSSLAVDDPGRALDWLPSIQDQERRTTTLLDIYDTWLDDDLVAGRASLITRIPALSNQDERHELYALLHEKDPLFRAELYNLIEPGLETGDSSASEDVSPVGPSPGTSTSPEVRKAIPVLENPVEVEELAK